MNIKILISTLFILFLIFSTIGCVMSDISPIEDVTVLTKDYQVQEFKVSPTFSVIAWTLDGVVVLRENLNDFKGRGYTVYTLNYNDLSSGRHVLILTDGISSVEWTIDVIKSERIQGEIKDIDKQFSWNDTRNKWKEKSDKLMSGEET